MLAFRAFSSSTPLLRATPLCLRPLSHRFPVIPSSARFSYDTNNQRRLFSGSLHRPLPRVAPPIRKPNPEETPNSSEKPEVPNFLAELARDEVSTFERDAARFRARIGLPEPLRERHSRLRLGKRKQGVVAESKSTESTESMESTSSDVGPTPRFREEILKEDPTFEQPKFEDGLGKPGVWKQVAFVGLVTAFLFTNAAELTSADTKHLRAIFPSPILVTSEQLRRVRLGVISERLKRVLQKLKDGLSGVPNSLTYPFLWSYVQIANAYINASEGKRVAYQICAINGFIWMLWQFRVFRPFMKRHFTHHPLSGRSITLLTSIFSHESFIHFLANSFALISFGSAATAYLVKKQQSNPDGELESTPKFHFWAMFISAGLISGLVSHVFSARVAFPRLLAEARASKIGESVAAAGTSAFRRVGQQAASRSPKDILPSLGASGAIYATVTLTALAFPDAQVFLLFPPIPLPITWGVGAMVTLDIVGILRGWRLFDHWAHLSGAAFGVLYYKYGPDYWNWLRAAATKRMASYEKYKAKS